jgi:hypothetical protein
MLFDILDQNTDKDLASVRTFQLDNNKVIVTKEDPYGFWSIKFEKGRLPNDLSGHFTSFDHAEKAVQLWLARKDRDVKEVTK